MKSIKKINIESPELSYPVDRGHDQHAESGYPGIVHPWVPEEVAITSVSTGASIPQLMLGAAFIGQLAIAMIVLSRRDSSTASIAGSILSWASLPLPISGAACRPLPMTSSSPCVETLCLLLIVWFAMATWRNVEA